MKKRIYIIFIFLVLVSLLIIGAGKTYYQTVTKSSPWVQPTKTLTIQTATLACSIPVNTSKAPPISQELKEKYLPVWKELFMKKNNIDENYFTEHITVCYVFKNDWTEGESLVFDYQVKIDWAAALLTDSILVKLKGSQVYLTPDEVKTNGLIESRGRSLKYQISSIIPHNTVISYSVALDKVRKTCFSSLKPVVDPVNISRSLDYEYGELLFQTSSTISDKDNQCKFATMRLSDGEILSCSDGQCRIY